MAGLPLRDRAGNALLAVRRVAESELPPVAASLVVVGHAGAVLLMLDKRRGQWELPGGMREAGETAREAAVRELGEETGIHGVALAFAAVAEFDLVDPGRREFLAVYRAEVTAVPRLTLGEEGLGFRWWSPREPVDPDTSPLDAEIAARTLT
ncbi:NUDIX hydrolase [Amycolatopsis sp. Hca4]|uniref:NUDIX hydrolase n=1 Tax=Amycolatopsis sp. Hca4 TaxID=2742131 RepID=UPI00158FF07D|nr:NUDIX hydrolase [Amycolatopsis sp. Hca4]QKV79705.1 NUDIX hydrolase [Amycolatopsis sp. Hca4]